VGSAVAGAVNLPAFVDPVFRVRAEQGAHAAWLPWAAGIAAILASLLGLAVYTSQVSLRAALTRAFGSLAGLLEARYYFDQAYNWFARRVVVQGSEAVLWHGLDAGVIDATVLGTATTVDGASQGARRVQSGRVRGYALLILGGTVLLLGYLLWLR
jgi:NADH-quinone oxidoreductase subunit L